MSGRHFWTTMLSVGVLVSVVGCEHCGVRRAAALPPPMYEPCPPPANLPPHPLTPTQAGPIPMVPPGAVVPQSAIPPAPVPTTPGSPPPVGAEIRGYNPHPTAVPPAGANTEILTPSETPPPTPRLSPPVMTEEPPSAPPLPAPDSTKTAKPTTTEDAGFPVGIPQFSVAVEGVTAGLKPSVYGGLDWLQANHYKTVLHVKGPGEDDSSDRQVIEKYGLKYLSLELSPKMLCRATLAQFDRIIADPANRPLFVYDQNGVLAGGLWYLHFRLTEHDTDETARLKAARLGLKTEITPENRAMWLAVQQLIKDGIP
ncbi:MAG TPA: hypothetical protein VFA18_02640 [Gemmataceae bacterium]|nr:hypothetical protein [Gemmataceae bacterium]